MAVAKLGTVVLDCPDPLALATFYAGLLGGTPSLDEDGTWADLQGHEGTPLAFQKAPGHVPPEWPSAEASQQFHLDLVVGDLDAAEERILALGAKPLDAADPSRSWRVYADPAGHPVCLCAS
ncbi:VOC family protein [Streptomyces sp. NPDC051211]|uniref:VOC family protein n=1 Tax=Streptomyces sp. NPDC051211 TaxID=3154643 RepID=UPI00344BE156